MTTPTENNSIYMTTSGLTLIENEKLTLKPQILNDSN